MNKDFELIDMDNNMSDVNIDKSPPVSNESTDTIPAKSIITGTESFATEDVFDGSQEAVHPCGDIYIRSRANLTAAYPLPEADLVHTIPINGDTNNVKKSNTKRPVLVAIASLFIMGIISLVLVLVLTRAKRGDEDVYGEKYKKILKIIASMSGGDEIFDDKSPNSSVDHIAALEWMVKNDTFKIDNEWKIKQRYIIVLLFFSTKGLYWYDRFHFLTHIDECSWNDAWTEISRDKSLFAQDVNAKGILCNEEGRVTELRFYWNNLSGSLPHEIGNLNETLSMLNMVGGSISSTIPETLGNLENLNYLILGENCLSGTVPKSLAKLNLTTLTLNGNINLSGSLNIFSKNPKYAMADCGSCPGSQELVECDYCECCESISYQCCNQTGIPKYKYLNLKLNPVSKEPLSFSRSCLSEESQDWQEKECPCTFIEEGGNSYYPKCTTDCKTNENTPP